LTKTHDFDQLNYQIKDQVEVTIKAYEKLFLKRCDTGYGNPKYF
jgi:hypothetical protein